MLKRIVFLLIIDITLNTCSLFAQRGVEVVKHEEADGLVSYTLVIPHREFTKDSLLQLANAYLARFHQASFLNVGIFIDRPTALNSAGKGIDHLSFDWWKHEFENRMQIKSLSAAELLKYGGAATLRIRYGDGHIEEIPVRGKNLFHSTVDGMNLDLLHVTCVFQGFVTNKQLFPILYFRTSKDITFQKAEELAKLIFTKSGVIRMKINFRTDDWFIFDTFYPWLNPFSPAGGPPTEAQAARSAQYLCVLPGVTACYQTSGGTE